MSGEPLHGYMIPDPPVEEPIGPPPPHALIFRALLKRMKPVQAIIFMRLYEQFPGRFIPNNDFFFTPSVRGILSEMRLKEPVYWLMVGRLVEGGWLSKRKGRAGIEVRIEFEKLRPFLAKEGE